jgi:hypothetical protein
MQENTSVGDAAAAAGLRLRRLWRGCPEGCPTPGPHPVWLCDQCKNQWNDEHQQALDINEAIDSCWLTSISEPRSGSSGS